MSPVRNVVALLVFLRRPIHGLRLFQLFMVLAISCLPIQAQYQYVDTDGADQRAVASINKSLQRLERDATEEMMYSMSSLPDSPLMAETLSSSLSRPSSGSAVILAGKRDQVQPEKFNFKAAFQQSFGENLFYHVWRVSSDSRIRWDLAHKPFFHDWFASYKGFDMTRWGDGDDFIVNDVGHPLEGAVFARTFLQNSPGSHVDIGKNPRYWSSRLKATAWSAVWSVQLEIGPMSETSIGNQGGFTYVPGCGIYSWCADNPTFKKPPNNNTGWSDFVVTPVVGTAWVMAEDTLEKYIVKPVSVNHRILGGRILRSALEPSRSFAALFAGKFPWDPTLFEGRSVGKGESHLPSISGNPEPPPLGHFEVGAQYSSINLPVLSNSCTEPVCRKNLSGVAANLGYNFTRAVAFDSTLNFIPGQQGTRAMMEGLFGVRMGVRTERVGIFAKVRPGFIHYQNALPIQGESTQASVTRFATDLGGIVEYYPNRRSAVRVDLGTTLVRYLTNHPDPYPTVLGSLLSTQNIVTQGNFQFSTGYTVRF